MTIVRQLLNKWTHTAACTAVLAITGAMIWWGISGSLAGGKMHAALVITVAMCVLQVMFTIIARRSTLRQVENNWALAGDKVRLLEALTETEDKFVSSLKSIVDAVDAHDPYAGGHSGRVAGVAVKIGRAMNLSEDELRSLETAALFHDIGMLWVPTQILNKEQPLTSDEQASIRRHTVQGAELLDSVKTLKVESQAVLHHHERFDGTGYPYGLKGTAIPLPARIIAVADAFDAMTTERPYRSSLLMRDALEELFSNSGGQFDPRVVDAFFSALDEISRENESAGPPAKRFEARLYSMVGNC